MDKLLLSVLVVSGLCVVSSAVRLYHVVYELKTMTEAQRHCRENYTDLATIRDLQDLETLKATLDSSKMAASGSRAWIGLYVDSWRWSLSDTSSYKPGETEFRRWGTEQPNNRNGEELCALMYPDGTWHDDRCAWTYRPVCFDVKGLYERFVHINTKMTWTDAQSYCRQHHTDLAMVRNLEENLKVQNVMPTGVRVWIGLYRDGWKWSDGSNSSFMNWKSGEPSGSSEDCASADFSADGQWETLKCDVKSAFICYSDFKGCVLSPEVVKIGEEAVGWRESVKYCRDLNMELVSFPEAQHQRQIYREILQAQNDSLHELWIGMRRSSQSGEWYWLNKAPVNDTDWEDGEPGTVNDGQCAAVRLDKKKVFGWSDKDCCEPAHPVCYGKPSY